MNIITHNNDQDTKLTTSIENFFSRFDLEKIAHQSNTEKKRGFSFAMVFSYLIHSIFSNKSTYRDYLSRCGQLEFCDKTFRNLLNDPRVNWQKMLVLLAQKVILYLTTLTSSDRVSVFIVDDSMYERASSKKVELLAWQFDHAKGKQTRGFRFLQVGWSDGNSFVPVAFSLLSGKNRLKEAHSLDQRTNTGKRKSQALRKGTDVTIELLKSALKSGITANYVLFDSWFSSPKMFHRLRQIGLHAVTMVKKSSKVHYIYHGEERDVKQIFKLEKKRRGRAHWLLSVIVEAVVDGKAIPVKLVYVRNRNKRKDYLVLASTDTSLTEEDIIQLYGKRWSIEVYFKMCKQYLRLSKYQGLSYDGVFAHTTIVAISYLMLAIQEREGKDDRTIGELFYLMVEELSDITVAEAFYQLLELFEEAFKGEYALSKDVLNNVLLKFIAKLPQATQSKLMMVV